MNLCTGRAHFLNETNDAADAAIVARMLVSPESLSDGRHVCEYESLFRHMHDRAGHAFSFGAGRMALYAIMEALGVGEGDEVILPAFTCEVVVHALLYRRIRPVYADIDPVTFNIDPASVESRISPRTRVIIAQHTFGVPCDLKALLSLAAKHGIYVVEDCALALGSQYDGKPVGTHGHAAFFSTDRTKVISTQAGGMAFTRDDRIAVSLKRIHDGSARLPSSTAFNIGMQLILSGLLFRPALYPVGRYLIAAGFKSGIFSDNRDDTVNFRTPANYPCRLSNLQAAVGISQLGKLDRLLAMRSGMVRRYVDVLSGNGIHIDSYMAANLTLRFPLLLRDRDEFVRRWRGSVEIGKWFDSPAMGWYKDFETMGYLRGSCPAAEFVHAHVVNFPTCQKSERIRDALLGVVDTITVDRIAGYEQNQTV